MGSTALQTFIKDVLSPMKICLRQVRHGHHLRGKPPTSALSLKQRLELLNETDPTISFKVNIGFSPPKISMRKKEAWMAARKTNISAVDVEHPESTQENPEQMAANLEAIKKIWLQTNAPNHIHKIADHYGVFQDLFGDAFFLPVVPLEIRYTLDNDDTFARVYTGNVIKPAEACNAPNVEYEAKENSLWTLIMCTPDGNMENSNNEYCHWFLGNIPGNKIAQGEQIIDYIRPLPVRGVGYYRYIFILYKQDQRIDYTTYKKTQPCLQLQERNWNTLEFYRKHQDELTPAGVAFFQSDWDPTVTEFYHSVLNAPEPIFQYDFEKPYLKPQTWFPLKEPFNFYLDNYKDPRDVMKEYLLRKLKTVHPFKEPKPPLKYPNAISIDNNVPSWLKMEIQKERLGWGRVNELK